MGRREVVVVVGSFPELSQTFVVDHVLGLASEGWNVHVAVKTAPGATPDCSGLPGTVELHRLSAPPPSAALRRLQSISRSVRRHNLEAFRSVSLRAASYFAPGLRELLRAVDPALVHAHFAHNGILAHEAAEGKWPVVTNFHGYDVLTLPEREGWGAFRSALNGTDAIVHSPFLERHVSSKLDVRIYRVTLGVDFSIFGDHQRGSEWGNSYTLLCVGRLIEAKGQDDAINALDQLGAIDPQREYRLRIVGDGPAETSLQQLAHDLDLEEQVHFLGGLPPHEVAREMRYADVLLVPSKPVDGWQESFCRVAVEGMASGLAVVATRTGGLADTVGSGGWIVDPGSPPSLAQATRQVLEDFKPCEVAAAAHDRARNFELARMRADYAAVTRKLAR